MKYGTLLLTGILALFHSGCRSNPTTLIFAHRGLTETAPENSIAALQAAREAGVDGVEIDIRLTADGVPVLLHDATLDRTTTGSGPLRETLWEELQRRSLRRAVHRFPGLTVPALEAALKIHGLLFYLDLKTSDFEPVVRTVRACGKASSVFYRVYQPEDLKRLFSIDSEARAVFDPGPYLQFEQFTRRLLQQFPALLLSFHGHRPAPDNAWAERPFFLSVPGDDLQVIRQALESVPYALITDKPRHALAMVSGQ